MTPCQYARNAVVRNPSDKVSGHKSMSNRTEIEDNMSKKERVLREWKWQGESERREAGLKEMCARH